MSNIITIGSQRESKITAFGDDSKFNKTNAFAYVLFENPKIGIARQSLFGIKDKYEIPSHVPLHMRLLTGVSYKNKYALQHLTTNVLAELLSDIVNEMNKIPFLIKGCYFSGELPKDIDDDEEGMNVAWSDKGMQSMLARFALIPLNLAKYHYKDLRIVIAQDKTKTGFLGQNRRQAARWARGFSDIEAPTGYVYEFDPVIQESSEEILLQLADIAVYMIAHSFDPKGLKIYKSILEKVRNIDVHPFVFSPD